MKKLGPFVDRSMVSTAPKENRSVFVSANISFSTKISIDYVNIDDRVAPRNYLNLSRRTVEYVNGATGRLFSRAREMYVNIIPSTSYSNRVRIVTTTYSSMPNGTNTIPVYPVHGCVCVLGWGWR